MPGFLILCHSLSFISVYRQNAIHQKLCQANASKTFHRLKGHRYKRLLSFGRIHRVNTTWTAAKTIDIYAAVAAAHVVAVAVFAVVNDAVVAISVEDGDNDVVVTVFVVMGVVDVLLFIIIMFIRTISTIHLKQKNYGSCYD